MSKIELPPLPRGLVYTPARGTVGAAMYTYTADQMQAYADACTAALRAELDFAVEQAAKNADEVLRLRELLELQPMTAVADRYAHRLALSLECILADDYSGAWWNDALTLLGEYRSAMNAIHEQHSPTWMGEPVLSAAPKGTP